jgi:hypothetical protein
MFQPPVHRSPSKPQGKKRRTSFLPCRASKRLFHEPGRTIAEYTGPADLEHLPPLYVYDVKIEVEDDGELKDVCGFDCIDCDDGYEIKLLQVNDISQLLDNIFDYDTKVTCTVSPVNQIREHLVECPTLLTYEDGKFALDEVEVEWDDHFDRDHAIATLEVAERVNLRHAYVGADSPSPLSFPVRRDTRQLCGCKERFENESIWVGPTPCEAVCSACGDPLCDPCGDRGVQTGCDVCC